MTIKILGSGCKSCRQLADNTGKALADLRVQAGIIKVTDFSEIAAFGVLSTPALVIDDTVVSYGKVLKPAEISLLIQPYISKK